MRRWRSILVLGGVALVAAACAGAPEVKPTSAPATATAPNAGATVETSAPASTPAPTATAGSIPEATPTPAAQDGTTAPTQPPTATPPPPAQVGPTATATPTPPPTVVPTPTPTTPPPADLASRTDPGDAGMFTVMDEPSFIAAAQASYLAETDLVLGLELAGEARAYPVLMAWFHHIINDTVNGRPITVTY